jgi:hypothetical protein
VLELVEELELELELEVVMSVLADVVLVIHDVHPEIKLIWMTLVKVLVLHSYCCASMSIRERGTTFCSRMRRH